MSNRVCSLTVTEDSSLNSLVEQAEASISKKVEMDAASLVMVLINSGFFSDPLSEEYDSEDYQYHYEYRNDESSVND